MISHKYHSKISIKPGPFRSRTNHSFTINPMVTRKKQMYLTVNLFKQSLPTVLFIMSQTGVSPSLGNLYSMHPHNSRWFEAQQDFLHACRGERKDQSYSRVEKVLWHIIWKYFLLGQAVLAIKLKIAVTCSWQKKMTKQHFGHSKNDNSFYEIH